VFVLLIVVGLILRIEPDSLPAERRTESVGTVLEVGEL